MDTQIQIGPTGKKLLPLTPINTANEHATAKEHAKEQSDQ
jgi:hypothetical protein